MPPDSSSPRRLRRRIISFLTVVLSILLAGNAFVCLTWNHFCKVPVMPLWIGFSFVLTLAFVATSILGRFYSSAFLNFAYRISAVWLAFLNYFLFAAMAAWILLGVTRLEPRWIGAICFGGAVLVTIYGLANASWLRVTHVTVKLANLPDVWRDGTVALVTDMHLGNVRGAGFSRRIVARLEQLRPALVCISGDLFDGPEADFDALLEPWKKISATMEIYFVTGNHEEFTGRRKYLKAAEGAGIRILNDEKVEVRGLQIAGVHDEETHDPERFRAILRRAQLDRSRACLLLAHQPLHLEIPRDEGVSLMLSGHTHGGQFWPWIYAARRVHGRFNHGLNRLGDLQVLTSYGAGTWGAPMRVGTKSEIVLIHLEPAV
jgi:uncharacterized protein